MKKSSPSIKIREFKSDLPDPLYNGCFFKVEGLPLYFLLTRNKEIHPVGTHLRTTIFKQCGIEVSFDFFLSLFPDKVKLREELDPDQTHLWVYHDNLGGMKYLFEYNKNRHPQPEEKARKAVHIEFINAEQALPAGAFFLLSATTGTACPFNLFMAAPLPPSTLTDIDTNETALKYQR